jgi:hypothetical protein
VFIQVIQGRCSRQDELRALSDEWVQELGPAADGWLGGTYGFTDDGTFIGVIRFEDREKAMANSGRPEQDEWAQRMTALFDGPVEFHDSDDVTVMLDGGSDDAGFVQVIRGKVDDVDRLRAIMTSNTDALRENRPDILGATLAIEPDGSYTDTIAFTDEASAREGEKKEPPPEVAAEFEWSMQSGATFYDLRNPWFASR